MRVWEDVNGLQIKGKFIREIFGSIEIRRPNGELHSISIEDLSAEDLTLCTNSHTSRSRNFSSC